MSKSLRIWAVKDVEVEKQQLIQKINASTLSTQEKCRLVTRVHHKMYDKADEIKLQAAIEKK